MSRISLKGYRIVDFGWVWAGTMLGSVLADYGAELIKIESRRRVDGTRLGKVFEIGNTLEVNPWFHNLNRGKRSVTIDFTRPEGAQLVKQLVRQSDAVIENFNPGVLQKHGLAYDSLAKENPRIVMVSIASAGQQGPWRDVVTYAPTVSALSGLESVIGYPDGKVLGLWHAYGDFTASIYGLFSLLVALYHSRRTGKGQYIDLSQLEAGSSLLGEMQLELQMTGKCPVPKGNRNPVLAPHGFYPCKGDDKWVSIAVGNEQEWQAMCEAMESPPWGKDKRFASLKGRLGNLDELDKLVASWTVGRTNYEVMQLLQAHGVAAAPCLNKGEVFLDPHLSEREICAPVEHPMTGTEWLYCVPWREDGNKTKPEKPAPLLGQDNDYVFKELLHLPDAEISRLTEEKVIY